MEEETILYISLEFSLESIILRNCLVDPNLKAYEKWWNLQYYGERLHYVKSKGNLN